MFALVNVHCYFSLKTTQRSNVRFWNSWWSHLKWLYTQKHLKYQLKMSSIFPLHLQKGKKKLIRMVPSKQTHHQNSTKFLQFKNNFLYLLVAICHLYCDIAQMIKRLHFQEKTLLLQRKKSAYGSLETVKTPTTFSRHLLLWIALRACAAWDIFQTWRKKKKSLDFGVDLSKISLMPLYFERGRHMTG